MTMLRLLCRTALFAGLAALLAACGNGARSSNGEANAEGAATGIVSDIALGPASSGVTVIEYASTTCPACRQFHLSIVQPILEPYARLGKIQYIFREFPTAPANIAVAGSVIARCAGGEKYFDVLDDLFENQPGIMAAVRQGAARDALEAVAGRHGITAETMEACLQNEELRDAVAASQQRGIGDGVSATPTLFINGRKLQGAEGRTPDSMTELLETAIAQAAGE